VQLLVDNVRVYKAHDFELETAQLSPRQPYIIEERLPTDVEAECQSEIDGSERRGSSEQRFPPLTTAAYVCVCRSEVVECLSAMVHNDTLLDNRHRVCLCV